MPKRLRKKAEHDTEGALQDEVYSLPLIPGEPFPVLEKSSRVLFQRCCEIYRISSLFCERKDFLLDIFSRYRAREVFESVLATHYFGTEEQVAKETDPELLSAVAGAYHFIRTAELSLRYTEALPATLAHELTWIEAGLRRLWLGISEIADKKYGWKFRHLD